MIAIIQVADRAGVRPPPAGLTRAPSARLGYQSLTDKASIWKDPVFYRRALRSALRRKQGYDVMVQEATHHRASVARPEAAVLTALGARSIVLVGMMGAGKSSIGRRLALRLGIPFVDADVEIEKAAGMTIPDIFAIHGEPDFRAGEARVIARLLDSPPQVLATGGGAFMNSDTRALIARKGISLWLKAEFDVLMRRIRRRGDRPLLKTEDPAATLKKLMEERYPVYEHADVTLQSREIPHDKIVDEIVETLAAHMAGASTDRPAIQPPEIAS